MSNNVNIFIGNWKNLTLEELRLSPKITMNKGFFSVMTYFLMSLPYIEEHFMNKNISLSYYSHNYGSYPNFDVFGNLIKFKQTINNGKHTEKINIEKIYFSIYGNQTKYNVNNVNNYYSFKYDFKKAHHYYNKYFEFRSDIIEDLNEWRNKFIDKKILGLHFRGTDKNESKYIQQISIDEFLTIVDYHLSVRSYDAIFIATDEKDVVKLIHDKYINNYKIFFNKQELSDTNKAIHIKRYEKLCEIINSIKREKNYEIKNIYKTDLKKECLNNEIHLKNVIIDSLILSICTTVLKTHSQVSAYSKIFNPNLEIYRLNGCQILYYPDSNIPIYPIDKIDNIYIKNIIISKTNKEPSDEIKNSYLSFKK